MYWDVGYVVTVVAYVVECVDEVRELFHQEGHNVRMLVQHSVM